MASHIIAVSILVNFISFSDEKTISGLPFPVNPKLVALKEDNSNSQKSTPTAEPTRPTSTNDNNNKNNNNNNDSNDNNDDKNSNKPRPTSQPVPPPPNPPPSPAPAPAPVPDGNHIEVVNSSDQSYSNPPQPTYSTYAENDSSEPIPSQGDVVPNFPKKTQKSKSSSASNDDPLIITVVVVLVALVILAIAVFIIRKVKLAPRRNMKKRMHEDLSYVFEPTPHNNANWPISSLSRAEYGHQQHGLR